MENRLPVLQRYRSSLVALVAFIVLAVSVAYRFSTMGGPLGGFENDQFVTLSQAQQIVMGDWPLRDFVELGMPLTVLLSAAGQALVGHTLFAEAVIDREYREIREVDFGRGFRYRLLARREVGASSVYSFEGLPCFGDSND